ncbi:MAG: hypothetical protein IPH73_08785 [Rhodocyclales bacterium]|nr:hypothetical protein [Rhodocyclales bacterium]
MNAQNSVQMVSFKRAATIGIQAIAEGVVSEAEMQALADVGFDGATGPAVKDPA